MHNFIHFKLHDVWLLTPNTERDNNRQDDYKESRRDYYTYVMRNRTFGTDYMDAADGTNRPRRWGSLTPIIWSETRLHLQKAWIAASSEMVPGATGSINETGNVESMRKYAVYDARESIPRFLFH